MGLVSGASRPIKIRHTAVLALVSWYLIMPHLLSDGRADMSVPLSHWNFYHDTKEPDPHGEKLTRQSASFFALGGECQQKIDARLAWIKELYSKVRWMECRPNCAEPWEKAICIATDDPRLKEN
jgi:hypothetical protein